MNDLPRQYTWHINDDSLELTDVGLPNDLVLALIADASYFRGLSTTL